MRFAFAGLICCCCLLFACTEDYSDGKEAYDKLCASCHGAQGQGLGALIPPLAQSDWLTKPEYRAQIPCSIRKGMQGRILVNGQPYEGVMQAFPTLTDVDINNIMNYIGTQWGNQAQPFLIHDTRKALEACQD